MVEPTARGCNCAQLKSETLLSSYRGSKNVGETNGKRLKTSHVVMRYSVGKYCALLHKCYQLTQRLATAYSAKLRAPKKLYVLR